jgi:hypothetical protein
MVQHIIPIAVLDSNPMMNTFRIDNNYNKRGLHFLETLFVLASQILNIKNREHAKIEKRKKQVHPAHNIRFNHDLQLEIDCIEWALKKIEVNKLPMDRLEGVIRVTIKDLEKKRQSHEKIRH